jgi:hypothetical protein
MARKATVLLVLIAVIATAGFVGYRYWLSKSNDPNRIALPEMIASSDTRAWLSGKGIVVDRFSKATKSLRTSPPNGPSGCRQWIETSLGPLGAPSDFVAAASASPDQATAEMAIAHFDVTTRWLAACIQSKPGPSINEVRTSGTLLERRLSAVRQ